MILDAHNLFSDAQALTAAAASTNLIDLGPTTRDIGTGKPLYVVLNVDVALTDAGSDSTVVVTIEQDTTAAFSSATAVQTLFTIAATAAIGTQYIATIAPGVVTEEFIRLYYTPANGNLTTGSVTAALVETLESVKFYADGFTIS